MGVTHKNMPDRARIEILVFTRRKADLKFKIFLRHRLSLMSGLRPFTVHSNLRMVSVPQVQKTSGFGEPGHVRPARCLQRAFQHFAADGGGYVAVFA